MALEQKLHLKLAQKLVMTPTLQQAIKLLQLSRLELEQALAQELQVNPVLELTEESPAEDEVAASEEPAGEEETVALSAVAEEGAAGPAQEDEAEPTEDPFGEVELDALFTNYLHDSPTVGPTWEDAEEAPLENSPGREASMFDALREQLGFLAVPDDLVPVCEFIIGNLDPDGYLRSSEEEVAAQIGTGLTAEAIAWVQRLEPPGIGARDLRECFLIQLARLQDGIAPEKLEITREIVAGSLEDLLHQRWEKLMHRHGISRDEIREVLEIIHRLDPRPGTQLGPTENPVVEPDVIVIKDDEGWRVALNDEGLPRLRLSARYLRLLQSKTMDGATTGYLRERMRAALWFLRSVEQRQSTILRVSDAIVHRQRDFLERGLSHLRPLVLRDIADDIGMHESTVSRVVANKYIATPRGVFPLKYFFHSAISHAIDGDISSVVVKERIRELISQEDAGRPLSDARVARQLNRIGIRIARRTVAKYREELGIPSSEQRRRSLR
jgi:RNA polymerase sigma-54 factor